MNQKQAVSTWSGGRADFLVRKLRIGFTNRQLDDLE
jgi:hypothetical protein